MDLIVLLSVWVGILSVWAVIAVIYFAGPAYLKEKGKNLATREDIGTITKIVEQIRHESHEDLERLKAALAETSEAVVRRRNNYDRMSGAMRIFIQGQFPDAEARAKRQQDFLDAYVALWLWAPDDLIRSLNTFILMNQTKAAEDNPRQRELKAAFFEVLLQMRKDTGFGDAGMVFDDLVFAHF